MDGFLLMQKANSMAHRVTAASRTFVVVGSAFDLPGFELKHGLGSVQSLNLTTDKTKVFSGGSMYRPTTSITLSAKSGSLLS